jgi:Mn-dependent DtxR family transcriptional regulator
MAKQEECKTEVGLLQNLLAIELWRGGLSQGEIARRLGVATGTVNEMLKGVNREILTKYNSKE